MISCDHAWASQAIAKPPMPQFTFWKFLQILNIIHFKHLGVSLVNQVFPIYGNCMAAAWVRETRPHQRVRCVVRPIVLTAERKSLMSWPSWKVLWSYPKRSQKWWFNGGLTSQTSDLRSRNFAVSAKMMLWRTTKLGFHHQTMMVLPALWST